MKTRSPSGRIQTGAALVVSMILLAVITVLSLSAMRNTNLDTRIAANHQHKQLSFQAAENALSMLTASRPAQSSSGQNLQIPVTTPGATKGNVDYYQAANVSGQITTSSDLNMEFIATSTPGQYKFSGFGLDITTLIYQADAIGQVDNTNTQSHNRMGVALVRQ